MKKEITTPQSEEKKSMLLINNFYSNKRYSDLQLNASYPCKDRYYLVYIILIIHGIGTLIPWNMFITAKFYFVDYKLNVTTDDKEINEKLIDLRKNFLSYVGFSAQLPNIICNGLNLLIIREGGALFPRIVGSILVELALIILTIALVIVDTSKWPILFFYITLFSVVIIYMATGVYQNCIFGLAANLPMKYTNAVVTGSNISGTLTSIINIFTIVMTPNEKSAAIYYFLIAFFILFTCFLTYFALPFNAFYKHYCSFKKPTKSQKAPPYLQIFKSVWVQCLNVFNVFLVTLAVFPTVLARIQPYDNAFNLSVRYFSEILCYLVFNMSAMIGNFIPNIVVYPKPEYLWIPVTVRFLFIPFFLFCNFNPRTRVWVVLFKSDYNLLFGSLLLGLSSGYCSSLGMMASSKSVNEEYASAAGMMASFFLTLGIFCGILVSFFLTWLVETNFLKFLSFE